MSERKIPRLDTTGDDAPEDVEYLGVYEEQADYDSAAFHRGRACGMLEAIHAMNHDGCDCEDF